MARRSAPKRKVTKIHWIWVVLAVIAIAIPLTLFLSNRNTDNRQHAAGNENKVLDVKLSGACKDNKKNPKNSYRRGEYLCENGATGEIPNRNNSCDKRAEWMTRAQKLCDENVASLSASLPPVLLTATPSGKLAAPPIITCIDNGIKLVPPGGRIHVRLTDTNKKPIVNAKIDFRGFTFGLYANGEDQLTTDKDGYAYAYQNVPYDLGQKGTGRLDALYEDVRPNSVFSNSVRCTTNFYYSSPDIYPGH